MLTGLLLPAHLARDLRILFNILAGRESLPELAHERATLVVVQVTKEGLHSSSGLLSLVERNATRTYISFLFQIFLSTVTREGLREQMVNNMSANDTMEEVAIDPAEVAVDGRQSALDESPPITAVMVDGGVIVM